MYLLNFLRFCQYAYSIISNACIFLMLYFAEFLHTRVFRNIVDFLYSFTLLKSMVTGLCQMMRFGITLPSYHRDCFNSDEISSKRRVITTRPGQKNAIVFWAINDIQISNQGQRSFL